MAAEVLQKIGKYEVLSKIGEGGMGVVYKARDPLIDRIVAIKMMTGTFAEDKDARERFLREARAVGKLQHTNIVTMYDLGVEGNAPYMVMEFLDGQGLDKVLAARVALTLVQKLDYMAQICNALHYAHEHDIVHRDVKPANVIVLKGGEQVKLVDFGIARAGSTGITRTGFAIGTTSYMSPEQIEASKSLDRRSDVFSAGVMMYEVLTNNLPFPGSEPIAIAIKILREPYPPLAAWLAEYPPELDNIIARALAKDRDERYSTAEEFAFDLARLQEDLRRKMVSQYIVEGRASFQRKDLAKARELLSYVLKVDPSNSEARQLIYEIQKLALLEKRSENLRQLRANAEEAIGHRQYDEALSFIDQALKLDTKNTELLKQRELVLHEQQRRAEVKKRLNLAQSAESEGNLEVAQEQVDRALSLDPTDTSARIIKANIEQEITERKKQRQVRDLLDVAKTEMAERRFTAAKEAITRAEELQPESPEIQALKRAIISGHAQELRRRDLERTCNQIQGMLAAEDLKAALQKIELALQEFPGEASLLQLKTAAERQRQAAERRRKIDERIAAATRLMNEGKSAEALQGIQEACQEFPEETRLQKFLLTVRESAEREKAEKLKNEQLQKAKDALGRKDYQGAIGTLERARIEFPAASDIADLLHYAREAALRAQEAEEAAAAEAAATAEKAAKEKTAAAARVAEEEKARAAARAAAEEKARAAARAAEEERAKAAAAARAAEEERTRAAARAAAEERARAAARAAEEERAKAAAARIAEEERARAAAAAAAEQKARAVPAPPPSAGATAMLQGVRPPEYEETIAVPPSVRKAEAPVPPKPEAVQEPERKVAVPPPRAPVHVQPPVAPSSKKWIGIGAAVAVVVVGVGLYFALRKTTVSPTTETTPKAETVTPAPTVPAAPSLGTLSVEAKDDKGASIDSADVFVDNQLRDTPIKAGKVSLQLSAGKHEVRLEKAGYEAAPAQAVDVAKDRESPIRFVLKKSAEAAAAPLPNPYLMITSVPGATVKVDQRSGENVGPDGKFSVQVDPGKHRLELTLRGYKPWSQTVSAKAGDRIPIRAPLEAVPPPLVEFSANPSSIREGQATELKWDTQNATEVTIEGIGTVPARGSRQVSPRSSTTYTLLAKGEGQPTQKAITVSVAAVPKPSIDRFTAVGASTIQRGGKARLEWATENATEVSIERIGKVDVRGSREVSPSETTSYVLTARGAGGSVSSQPVRIVVEAPPAAAAATPTGPSAEELNAREVAAIKNLIERQLKSAYESMSMAELQRVWPDMPKAVRDDTRALFQSEVKNIKMDFKCDPAITGDTASARCSQTMSYTMGGKAQPSRSLSVVFTLKKVGGAWQLQSTRR